jgi:hypothetical protein
MKVYHQTTDEHERSMRMFDWTTYTGCGVPTVVALIKHKAKEVLQVIRKIDEMRAITSGGVENMLNSYCGTMLSLYGFGDAVAADADFTIGKLRSYLDELDKFLTVLLTPTGFALHDEGNKDVVYVFRDAKELCDYIRTDANTCPQGVEAADRADEFKVLPIFGLGVNVVLDTVVVDVTINDRASMRTDSEKEYVVFVDDREHDTYASDGAVTGAIRELIETDGEDKDSITVEKRWKVGVEFEVQTDVVITLVNPPSEKMAEGVNQPFAGGVHRPESFAEDVNS